MKQQYELVVTVFSTMEVHSHHTNSYKEAIALMKEYTTRWTGRGGAYFAVVDPEGNELLVESVN